jgi:hypothetical protein
MALQHCRNLIELDSYTSDFNLMIQTAQNLYGAFQTISPQVSGVVKEIIIISSKMVLDETFTTSWLSA